MKTAGFETGRCSCRLRWVLAACAAVGAVLVLACWWAGRAEEAEARVGPIPAQYLEPQLEGWSSELPERPQRLQGVVLSRVGELLAGVNVTAFRSPAWAYAPPRSGPPEAHRTATDQRGQFAFPELPGAGPNEGAYLLAAELDGRVDVIFGAETSDNILRLTPERAFCGMVRDETGQPVANAEVRALELAWWRENTGQLLDTAWTDSAGRYRLQGARHRFALYVCARGYAPYVEDFVSLDTGSLDVTLNEGTTFSGWVCNAETGEALPHVPLRLFGEQVPLRLSGEQRGERRDLKTDAKGNFRIPHLRDGVYVLVPWDKKYASLDGRNTVIDLVGGQQPPPLEVPVVEGASISGTVVDSETGQPVAGLDMGTEVPERGYSFGYMPEDETDALGRYSLTGLRAGTYRLRCPSADVFRLATGEESRQGILVTVEQGEHVEGVNIEFRPRKTWTSPPPVGYIQGRLVDEAGSPVVPMHVGASFRDETGHYSAGRTLFGRDGAFLLECPVPGVYDLWISPGLHGFTEPVLTRRTCVEVREGWIADIGDIPVVRGSSLAGVVKRPDAAPYPGAYVTCRATDPDSNTKCTDRDAHTPLSGYAHAGTQGLFLVMHLRPGPYDLYAERDIRPGSDVYPEKESEHVRVSLGPGEHSFGHVLVVGRFLNTTIYLPAPTGSGHIAGTVMDSRGQPVYRAKVGITASKPDFWAAYTYTDRQGRYRYGDLPMSEYFIKVYAPFYWPNVTDKSLAHASKVRVRPFSNPEDVDFTLERP